MDAGSIGNMDADSQNLLEKADFRASMQGAN